MTVLYALAFCTVFPFVLWAVEANLNADTLSNKIKYFFLYCTFSGQLFMPEHF